MKTVDPSVIRGAGMTVSVSRIGARVVQLTDATGRRWLVETDRPEPEFTGPTIDFEKGTRGGWDECIPSIDAADDPNPGRADTTIADHGDFWSRRWNLTEASSTALSLDSGTIRHPLLIRKRIQVHRSDALLRVDLEISNTQEYDYRFLASAHPLFAWPSTARLEIGGAGEVRPGFGAAPAFQDDHLEMTLGSVPSTFKIFVRWDGVARLRFAGVDSTLVLRNPDGLMPWLGICVNRGSWPLACPGADWIALEPTTSPTDSLLSAIEDRCALTLNPGGSVAWTNTIAIIPD
jgi:galactose mutarotase-like enzyme